MLRALLAIGFILAALPAAACSLPSGYESLVAQVVQQTNDFRNKKRRTPLSTSGPLMEAAQAHACHMAATGAFSHTGNGGSQVQDRVAAQGYNWRFVAENIAFGQPSPSVVFTGWRKSRGHRRNMLNKRARDIGIGIAMRNGRPYWVMVLAASG